MNYQNRSLTNIFRIVKLISTIKTIPLHSGGADTQPFIIINSYKEFVKQPVN